MSRRAHAPAPADGGWVKTTLRVPAELHRRLRLAAAADRTTATDILEAALVEWLARREAREGRGR